MKISEKKYARLLFEQIKGKSGKSAREAVGSFVEILAQRNELAKAEKIARIFGEIWNREKGIVEAEVVVSRKPEKGTLEFFRRYVSSRTGAGQIEISAQTDESILGGAVLRYGDKILDASLKTKLIDLKNKISK